METPLRILVLEDKATDAELLIREVKGAGFAPEWRRVETEADFLAELGKAPDLILSDYSLPHFDGLRAVRLVRERGLDTPFILVSGTLGEEAAVEAMKFGADDYLMKGRTVRLGLAIRRLLEEKRLRGERKRVEEIAHESAELNRGVLNSMGAHIAVLDHDGKIIAVNDAWRQFAGENSEQSPAVLARTEVGTNYLEVCRHSQGACSAEAMLAHDGLQAVLRRDKNDFTLEYPCHSPKVKRWFVLSATPLQTKNGGAVVAHIDITERRKLEEQFRQSQKMEGIGQLASGVAHDFNNILAVIQMQASLMKSGENLSPEQNELVDDIGATVERAAALTRQLLLFSRKEVLREQDLDLNESIESMLKMLRRTIGEDIQTQLKLAAQPMLLHADPGMMDQVLLNLAVNARDAMPQGGQLVIETSGAEFDEQAAAHSANIRPGSFVCLSVGDSGCGIPPEILSKIFEPFFTTKEVGKGTGLGLATVFGIVHQHHGWINVYSEVGQGTTFRIYLPRLAKLSGRKSPETTLTTVPGGNETLLLVEDDPSLRVMVQLSLSRLGYQVLIAANGVEALAVWKAHRDEIKLVLTDMVMPGGMNGIQLGAQLLKENPKLKVIYASGYSAEVAGKNFPLKEGVNFLNKPFQRSKLAQTVRAMLDAEDRQTGSAIAP